MLNGGEGASNAINSVFVDFSANEQTVVERTSWSLGFYCGSKNVIKMNETTGSSAMAASSLVSAGLSVGDAISAADSTTYVAALAIGRGSGSLDMVDDLDADLDNYVIKTDAVYLVKLGEVAEGESALYKVLVSTTSTGYTLQYAASGSSEVTTVEISKDSNYNYMYYSFGKAALVDVEPMKTKWDIRWSKQTYKAGTTMPYVYADYVVINTFGGVEAVQVLESDYEYEAFTLSNIDSVEFTSDINVIGSNWRATTGNGIYTDRFYVVKDASDNYYKLRFLRMGVGSDGGTRGYPEIEYALLKN